ncbi:hypothetical protein D3C86_1479740 [compost metagenome]
MHHRQRLHVPGQGERIGQRHHPGVEIHAVEVGGQSLAVVVFHMGISQAGAPHVQTLPRHHPKPEGRFLGAVNHHHITLADKGHPPV